MLWRPHGRAETDQYDLRRAGLCDRCGHLTRFDELMPQFYWAGENLAKTGYLVCRGCIDIPAPFQRPKFLEPDPPPVYGSSPLKTLPDIEA